mgnify:CR=1 FL=1
MSGIVTNRATRRQLERDNAKWPLALQPVPRDDWPESLRTASHAPTRVWRSRHFLVQEYSEARPVNVRLSVSRTTLDGDRWKEGIGWDELMHIKAAVGYAGFDAVEVFPAERDVVNVANMRHLWVLAEPLPFAWRSDQC